MMKILWLCVLLLIGVRPLRAATLEIKSPDIAQIYADSQVTRHSLFWNSKEQMLYANVEFSNYLYATQDEPMEEQSAVFRLPGIKLDPVTGGFYVETRQGARIQVAKWGGFLVHYIKPANGTTLTVLKHSGEATVTVTADSNQEPCDSCGQWTEKDTGMPLQHFLNSIGSKL